MIKWKILTYMRTIILHMKILKSAKADIVVRKIIFT